MSLNESFTDPHSPNLLLQAYHSAPVLLRFKWVLCAYGFVFSGEAWVRRYAWPTASDLSLGSELHKWLFVSPRARCAASGLASLASQSSRRQHLAIPSLI